MPRQGKLCADSGFAVSDTFESLVNGGNPNRHAEDSASCSSKGLSARGAGLSGAAIVARRTAGSFRSWAQYPRRLGVAAPEIAPVSGFTRFLLSFAWIFSIPLGDANVIMSNLTPIVLIRG